MVGVIVVDTQISSNGARAVVLILGVEILHGDTATEAVADVMAVGEAEGHIAGIESARLGTVDVSALDITVAEVLDTYTKSAMFHSATLRNWFRQCSACS